MTTPATNTKERIEPLDTAIYLYRDELSPEGFKTIKSNETLIIQNVGQPEKTLLSELRITFHHEYQPFQITYTKADGTQETIASEDAEIGALTVTFRLETYVSVYDVNIYMTNTAEFDSYVVSAEVIYGSDTAPQDVVFAPAPYNWENVVIGGGGGFVVGSVYSTIEDVVYIRTDIGGLYRKMPGDEKFVCLSDWVRGVTIQGVESIAVHPTKPGVVYAAMGTYIYLGPAVIARSEDYGNTWSQIVEMPFNMGGNAGGRGPGERLAIDPNDPDVMYYGCRAGYGLWRSNDAGLNWERIDTFTNPGAVLGYSWDWAGIINAVGVLWVTFDTINGTEADRPTRIIYAGVADGNLDGDENRKNASVYVSKDYGVTWNPVPGQLTSDQMKDPDGNPVTSNLNIVPVHGKLGIDNCLYVSYSNSPGPYDGPYVAGDDGAFSGTIGAVMKYDIAAETWIDITPDPALFLNRAVGFGGLSVDAANPGVVMVATQNLWEPDEQILRSTDGGLTWDPIWTLENNVRVDKYNPIKYQEVARWLDWGREGYDPATHEESPKMGWMINSFEINPRNSDQFLYGTGATLFGGDNLTNWDRNEKIDIEVKADGVEETAVLTLISPTEGAHLISGIGDIYGFVHKDLKKSQPMILPVDDDGKVYEEQYVASDFAGKKPSVVAVYAESGYTAVSTDGGDSWKYIGMAESGGAFTGKVAVSADGAIIVNAPGIGACKYYDLNNPAAGWTTVNGIAGNAAVVSDRVNPELFYACAGDKLYVSTDKGQNFAEASQIPTEFDTYYNLTAVPDQEGHLYIPLTTDGLYRLVWNGTNGTLEQVSKENISCVGCGKSLDNSDYPQLYSLATIGSTWGVYTSGTQGSSWTRINDDKHQYANVAENYICADMRVAGRVYIGVNGQGIVMGNINE